jgi:hypothetical protein
MSDEIDLDEAENQIANIIFLGGVPVSIAAVTAAALHTSCSYSLKESIGIGIGAGGGYLALIGLVALVCWGASAYYDRTNQDGENAQVGTDRSVVNYGAQG